jgi:hypothetical protein
MSAFLTDVFTFVLEVHLLSLMVLKLSQSAFTEAKIVVVVVAAVKHAPFFGSNCMCKSYP